MKKNLIQKKPHRAFTLIELSFVLIVISVIVAGLVSIMSSRIANEKARKGNDNFAVIYQALGRYLLTNRALPCPASLIQSKTSSSTYGESISATNCVAQGVYQSSSNTNLIYGMVPTKTLGLGSEFAEDSYGNKIAYVVDKRLTTTTSDSFESNIQNSTVISISGGTSINNAIFVLISRGANQSGTYRANSSAIPTASSNSDELKNDAKTAIENTAPTPSTSSFDGTFVESSTVSGFDDAIFYKTAEQVLNDFDAWSLIPCTSASSSESLYGTTVTWPKTYSGQVVTADTACPTPNWNGSISYPTKKCGAKGVWGSVINQCTCTTGYSGASCVASNCTFSGVTGINDGNQVSVGTDDFPCDVSGYTGSVNYTCIGGGSPTINSGSCSASTCDFSGVTGIVDGTQVSTGSGSITCNANNYTGSISYSCSGGIVTPSGSCSPTRCSGGTTSTITVSGTTYVLHKFTSSDNLVCSQSASNSSLLIIGGGGGGGNGAATIAGGGGGAGGVVFYNGNYNLSATSYSIVIGGGGAASNSSGAKGSNGSNSSFNGTIIAKGGGGGGGSGSTSGSAGGAGGGGCYNGGGGTSNQTTQTGETAHYGYAGGASTSSGNRTSGGGGGAGSVGVTGTTTSTTGGNGGDGIIDPIGGTSDYFAGGGGGAGNNIIPTAGTGGSDVGGNGGNYASPISLGGGNGTPNTGSGGGGSNRLPPNNVSGPGNGGSGVVFVRYVN